MPHVTPERAFDFWPQHKLQLGKEAFSVPPMSLGRFLSVMATAPTSLESSMIEMGIKALQAATAPGEESARKLMAAFAAVPPADMWPLVEAVVPGLRREAWEEYGGLLEFFEIACFLASVHDWDLIGEELGSREAHETPARHTVIGALAMFSHNCGRSIEELFNMRLEGFFYYKRGYKEAFAGVEEPDTPPETMGAVGVKDTQKQAGIWDEMTKAEAPNG